MKIPILFLLVFLSPVLSCPFLTGYPDLLRGMSLGVSTNTSNTNTDCYLKTNLLAQKLESLILSVFYPDFSNLMLPVIYSNEMVVDLSDQIVACKFSTLINQFAQRTNSLSGFFDFIFTVGYAMVV